MPTLLASPLLHLWPLAIAVVTLVVAAVLQHRIGRIPNQVTFGAIAAAWAAALVLVESGLAPTAGGGIVSSVAWTFITLIAFLPAHAKGLLPAGCIKTQMAFAAWVGCWLAFGEALTVIALATAGGIVVTAIGVALYQIRQSATAQPEDEPIDYTKPPVMFPLQTTLSLGSIGGLVAILVFAAGRIAG